MNTTQREVVVDYSFHPLVAQSTGVLLTNNKGNATLDLSIAPVTPKGTKEYYAELIAGSIMVGMFLIGVVSNISVIVLFTKQKKLLTRTTYILRALAASDCTLACVAAPMYAINGFHHTWIFTYTGCKFYAFVTYWCGCTSVALLCSVTIERAMTVCANRATGHLYRSTIPVYSHVMVAVSYAWGGIWAILPLVGVQSYTYEGTISCSINWAGQTKNDFYYNIVIFAAGFIAPLLIIVIADGYIFVYVRRVFQSIRMVKSQRTEHKKSEWRLARAMVMTTAFYLLAWTPYAIVSMQVAFTGADAVGDLMFKLLAFFAKTSFIFNPFVYIGLHRPYRNAMKELYGKKQEEAYEITTKRETILMRAQPSSGIFTENSGSASHFLESMSLIEHNNSTEHRMIDGVKYLHLKGRYKHCSTTACPSHLTELVRLSERDSSGRQGLEAGSPSNPAIVLHIQQANSISAPNLFANSSTTS